MSQMQYVIDWTLDREAFKKQVRDLIYQARKGGNVLALPFQVYPGHPFFDLLVSLLSHVECEGCDAPCCKSNPEDLPLRLLPPEFDKLASKYGEKNFIPDGDSGILPMPCPFLKHNRCTIYPDRPLVCVLYPFQPGATDGANNMMMALASSCPEARRITRAVYLMSWRIRQQFHALGEENFRSVFRREGGV